MANLPDRSSEASLDEKFAGGISEKQSDSDGSSFPSDVSSEEEYPEGGRDAVLTVVGAFLVNFIEIGMTSVTGTLQAQYVHNSTAYHCVLMMLLIQVLNGPIEE